MTGSVRGPGVKLGEVPPTSRNWILTGSLDNLRATREHDFRVVGLKERRRRQAEAMEPGDLVAFYVTGLQAFAAVARITGEMFEDRTPLWPGKPGKPDPYPWRLASEPVIVLEEGEFVPAEELAAALEHTRKWPPEHWRLAFQGQIRTVPEADLLLIESWLRRTHFAGAPA